MKKKLERMEKLEREQQAAEEEFEKWILENPKEYEKYCQYLSYLDRQYLEEQGGKK